MNTDSTKNGRGRRKILTDYGKCLIILQLFRLIFSVAPCTAQTVPSSAPPRVLFMEHPGSESSDAALFTAIRAQLSVSSVTLDRAAPESAETMSDLSASARSLAEEHRATLVFWIEDKEPCKIHFFVPDDRGGQFSSRTIEVDLSNQSSRHDVIAVVASVMIEGLIAPRTAVLEKTRPQPTPPAAGEPKEAPRRRFELGLSYTGTLAATRMFGHGGRFTLGAFPLRRLFIAVSLSQYAPMSDSGEALRIQLLSTQLGVHTAVRFFPAPLEIRLGISYSVDFRSFSTTALKETIQSRADGRNIIHSFVPFLFAAWTYRDRIGIFGRLGASLAVNETVYRIRRASGVFTEELDPFDIKPVYQFGLLIRL